MAAFLFRRLLQSLLILLVMSFAIYGLIGLMPGDPIDLMITADPNLTTADIARLKALEGLDRPLLERWWRWLARAATGDLGYSRLYSVPVLEVLGPRLVNTAWLVGLSLVLALALAVPAGIVAALRPNGPLDMAFGIVAFAGISVPSFWLALMLIVLFAVQLGWLPAGGVGEDGVVQHARHLLLPVLTLTLLTAGTFVRFIRGAMLDVMRELFIRTARAKGCSPLQAVTGHALRHGLVPLATLVALHLGSLFSGALVVETVFAYLGTGKLIYDAILGNDFNLALTALLLVTAMTLVMNILADFAYVWLDPRVRYVD